MTKANPRRGSMQFWPRKRAKSETPRVRHWTEGQGVLGFAGFKAGMTHLRYVDNSKTSLTKGQEVITPATIVECPPMKVAAARFYKETENGTKPVGEVSAGKLDKEFEKSYPKSSKKFDDITDFDFIRLGVYTQPKYTGIGKKKPDYFEIPVGGGKDEQLKYAKDNLGGEVNIADVFGEGQLIDVHAVTTGKGYQGSVKRFGVKIREHNAEKTKRAAGSLGPWCGQGHIMWRVPGAGKMGYHLRTDYNKWILKIGEKPEEVNPSGGIVNYGFVKSKYVLVKGSIPGPKKRQVAFNAAIRPTKNVPKEAPSIEYISQESQQG
ncbi:MAG: 50S ribosomal protein L3 [Nanobdellota archaeon]